MVAQHYRWDFVGLSTDEKPTPETSEKVVDGSTFYCSDTSKLYVFCKDTWYERKALGEGGGGGTTYTAGDGIDITDDTISVDTDTIQEKLTAGTGIDITDNTISATGGGGGPTVVQTTGGSTTDVMSQDATTSMIYVNPSSLGLGINIRGGSGVDIITGTGGIALGTGSFARGEGSVTIGGSATNYAYGAGGVTIGGGSATNNNIHATALGYHANANANYSVALGSYAKPTRVGEVNIGADTSGEGYNSTNYRVIGGVHDGQLANDAVTVGQINALIDAINSATNSSIPHIGS